MDKTVLVGYSIEGGKSLLKELDQSDLEVTSAFWYYVSESEQYRLVIVTPFFDRHGPKKTYEKVQKVLRSDKNFDLTLSDIHLMGPGDPLNKGLRALLSSEFELSGVRITQSVVGGTYIEDAYLYRIG
jgi:hypothetical protein